MNGVTRKRTNPLMEGAFVLEDAARGERIIVHHPGTDGSRRELQLMSGWYIEDGTVVVDVSEDGGPTKTVSASSIGLTCDRFTGAWELVAMLDDTEFSES